MTLYQAAIGVVQKLCNLAGNQLLWSQAIAPKHRVPFIEKDLDSVGLKDDSRHCRLLPNRN
jgi:hypothetical protein